MVYVPMASKNSKNLNIQPSITRFFASSTDQASSNQSLKPPASATTVGSPGVSVKSSKHEKPKKEDSDDGSAKSKTKKKYKPMYIMVNGRPQGKIMVEETMEEETEERIRKGRRVKKKSVIPPPVIPSTTDEQPTELEPTLTKKEAKAKLKNKLQEIKQEVPEAPQKTIRIWHPTTQGKTMKIKVGGTGISKVEDDPFNLKNIHTTSYEAWKRAAKMQLPSAGGPPIEHLSDVINVIPSIQKEKNQKVVDNTIRRLSLLSNQEAEMAAGKRPKSILKTKQEAAAMRKPVADVENPESDSSEEESESSSEEDGFEVDSDEDVEKQERKMAGTDIRGKLQTLKELTEHLSLKRKFRQQIVLKATGHTVMDTEQIPLKEHILYMLEYVHDYMHDMFTSIKIWDRSLVEINGRYGVIAASYFIWLRRLVILNMLSIITTLFIVIIPQAIGDFENNDNKKATHTNSKDFSLFNLVDAEGYLHHSYMFYSGYSPRNQKDANPFKNPAVRFLLALIVVFLYNVYFIFTRMSKFYRGIRMEHKVSGFAHNQHFISIICGWDFSCGDPKAALFLRKTIHRELHILASAANLKEEQVLRISSNKNKRILNYLVKMFGLTCGSIFMHLISNAILLGSCATLGILLHYFLQVKLDYHLDCVPVGDSGEKRTVSYNWLCPDGDLSKHTLVMTFPALFSVVAQHILTYFIGVVGEMETWKTTERKVSATMFRAGLFYGTNLQVFFWFWASQEKAMDEAGFALETIFGKELYRLVVIQGLLDITINFAIRKIYHTFRSRDPEYTRSEFPTEYFALSMFYLHSIAMMTPIFSPGLGFLITIRLIFDFYRHRYALFNLHGNENYASHASSVYGPYLVTFFVTFLLTSFMNIFYMSDTVPCRFEGPFVNYKKYDEAFTHLFQDRRFGWIKYLFGPGFLTGFLALLIALVYFMREWAKAYEPIVTQLNDHIFLERADREMLLKAIFEIGRATRSSHGTVPHTTATATTPAPPPPPKPKNLKDLPHITISDRGMTTSAVPSSTDVSSSDAEGNRPDTTSQSQVDRKRGSQESSKSQKSLNKKEKKEIERLIDQVKGGEGNTTLTGLEKLKRTSITVDTWNAQRHRREAMERIVKGIVGARRNVRNDPALAYDPTSKIFSRKSQASSGSSSNSSNSAQTKKKRNPSAELHKLVERSSKSKMSVSSVKHSRSKSQQPSKKFSVPPKKPMPVKSKTL